MTTNLPTIRKTLTSPNMQESIKQRIGEKAGTFTTSLLDVIGESPQLQQCDPALVVKEALKAAGLDLPINKNLGFAYVIPYKEKGRMTPHFQMGYRGFIQLAIRTGQFRHLNAGAIYEGEDLDEDRIKGTVQITGKKKSDTAIGYFAYMQLTNGFEKAVAWTRDKVEAHAKRFSKSYAGGSSPWKTDFDAMACKTMILQLKSYMPMTIEMSQAVAADHAPDHQARVDAEIDGNDVMDIDIDDTPDPGQQEPDHVPDDGEMTDEEKAEIAAMEAKEAAEAPY
jgi:recombination protein RecT